MSNPFAKYLEASMRQEKLMEGKTNPRINTALSESIPKLDESMFGENTFKSTADIMGDTTVDAFKAAMTLAQTGISALDAGAYAVDAIVKAPYRLAQTLAPDELAPAYPTEYGQFTKLLDDGLGFNIGKAKQQLGELGYSDIRKAQEAELHTGYSKEEIDAFNNQWSNQYALQYQDLVNKGTNPLQLEAFKSKFEDNYKKAYSTFMDKYQTSWDKSLGENVDIIGHAFGKVADNPSLGAGAAIESTGYLLPSLAISKGIAALQGAATASAASRAVAAGTGEGLVSALALNEQMRGNSATGTIDGNKVAAGFAGGALTGLIGGISNRGGSALGLDDIDSLVLGTQAKGFSVTRPVAATLQEGGEEFLQGFGESIIPNIAEGKDPLQGLAQELALGTVAGAIMGGTMNARSLVSGAGSDLVSSFKGAANLIGKGKEAITAKTFEELNDPTNKAYDPAKAFNSQVANASNADEAVSTKAKENMDNVLNTLDEHINSLYSVQSTERTTLKKIAALPDAEQKQSEHVQTKKEAEASLKKVGEQIAKAEQQYMDLMDQRHTLGKNQEVQAGVPQYSEEQAKADIQTLSQELDTAIWRNQDTDLPVTVLGDTQLDDAGQEYTKVSYTDAATGQTSENYVPTAELVKDTTAQQEAAQRITKHFSKLSLDELDTVATSPYLTEEQRNSLRYLSETKRAMAALASPSSVTNDIMNGVKGNTPMASHRGLNNYTDMVNTAVNTKDEKLLNIALNDLGRFAQDHTDKANALAQANELVTSGKFSKVQVLRSNDGTWGIVTDPNKFVDAVKLKATAGWNVTVNSNKNGKINLVAKEATLIQDTLKSLTQIGLSFGLQAVEPTVTAPVSIETLREANKPVPKQSTDKPIAATTPQAAVNPVFNKPLTSWDTNDFNSLNASGTQKKEFGYRNFDVAATNEQVFSEVKGIIKRGLEQKNKTSDITSRIWEEYYHNNLHLNDKGRASFKAYIEYLQSNPTAINQGVTSTAQPVGNTSFPTWETLTKGQNVTLYRGESSNNTKDGKWWTTNKSKAEKYGKVVEVTLPAEVISINAAQGQGGIDEFYFADKTPTELIKSNASATSTQTESTEAVKTETPVSTSTPVEPVEAQENSSPTNVKETQTSDDATVKTRQEEIAIARKAALDKAANAALPRINEVKQKAAEEIKRLGQVQRVTGNLLDTLEGRYFLEVERINAKYDTELKAITDPVAQDNQATETQENNTVADKVTQSSTSDTVVFTGQSNITYNIPKELLNQKLEVTKIKDLLLQVTSNSALPTEDKTYLKELLNIMMGIKSSGIWVQLVTDLSSVSNSEIRAKLPTSIGKADGKNLYFYLDSKVPVDILQVIAHEYHHTLTIQGLVEDSKRTKELNTKLDSVRTAVSKYLATNPQITNEQKNRFRHLLSDVRETLTIGFVEPDIASILSTVDVNGKDALTLVREVNSAILNKDYTKTFKPYEESLNDLSSTRRRASAANQNSSIESTSNTTGTTTDTASENTGGNSTQQELGTNQQQARVAPVVTSVDETTKTVEIADGTVTVLKDVTEEVRNQERSKPFSARNLIKAYFSQKKSDNTNSPLVLVKDFISQLDFTNNSNLLTQLSKYLGNKTKVTDSQINQLKDFKRFHDQFKQNIQFIFGKRLYSSQPPQDMLVEYLQLEGRALDENVLTAISLAAYSYLIQYGDKAINTDDDIRDILRLEKDDYIPVQAAAMLRYAGFELPYVIKDMGKEIVQLLGLKSLKDADPTLQDRLESSLGTLAFSSLNDIGYLKIEHGLVDPKKLAPIMISAGYVNESGESPFEQMNKLTFVRMNFITDAQGKPRRDTDGEVFVPKLTIGNKRTQSSNDINQIIEASKESSGFLSKLFGLDIGYRVPTVLEPAPFNQQAIRKTKSTVPTVQKELLTEAQKTAFVMRANTVSVLNTLKDMSKDSKFLKQLLGIWVDGNVKARTNITERDSLEAKSKNEWRTLTNGLDWANQTSLGSNEYLEFYDTQQVAQNQRMSYSSNLFNMQGSQIHRAMATLSAYVQEINLDDTKAMSRFYQAVGEGLEGLDKQLQSIIQRTGKPYKFFTVDKVAAEDFVPALVEVLNTEANQQAIAAMVSVIEGNTPNQEQQDAIATFVDAGGMGVQSLQSLIALAEMVQAKEGKFTTSMGLGSDGVNNGVASANLLTGVIPEGMATQTGILPNTPNTPESMQQVYERGLTDYYVDFGNEMRKQLVEVLTRVNKNNPAVKAVLSLFKTYQEPTTQGDNNALAMRKIAKTWSVPFNYSAGQQSLQRALARGFLAGIYKEMNSIANKALDAKTTLELQTLTQEAILLQSKLNAILGFSNRVQFTENGKLLALNEIALNQQQENILANAVTQLHGKAAWQATQKFAKDYMAIRDTYIGVTKVSFELYNLVREQLIQAKLAEKRKGVSDRFEREYLGLTTEELKDIDKVLLPISPKLHSSLSAESTDLSAALSLTEQVDFLEEATLNRKTESKYFDKNTNTTPNITLGLNQTKETDGGVKPSALSIQSVDAYVAAYLQAQFPTLNVHDAGIFGLDYYAAATEYQNERYLNAMTTYHLGLEHAEALVRTYIGLQSFLATMEKYGLTEEQQKDFKSKVEAKLREVTFGIETNDGKVKVKGLKHYLEKQGISLPTDTLDAIEKVITLASNQDTAKLDVLENTKAIHQYSGEDGVYVVPKEFKDEVSKQRKEVITRAKAATKKLTNKATELADDGLTLVGYLEANKGKELSAQEVMKALNTRDKASKTPMLNRQEEAILQELEGLVSNDVKVIYDDGEYKGYGYFDEDTNTIYIKAKSSKGSKVNSHLLIHELLHSALVKRIATLKSNPESSKEAKQALNKLEALRLEILSKVDANSVIAKMLKNVDEFISYGLTDQRLQEALQQIKVERNGRSSKDLNTRWRTFVLAVMKLIGFNTGKNLDAMTAFALDTANLLANIKDIEPTDTIGSKHYSEHDFTDQVNQMTSVEVMQTLPHTGNSDFGLHLNNLAEVVIGQLYNNDEVAKAQIDVIQAIQTIPAIQAGFNLSQREAAVQRSLELVLETYLETSKGGLNVGQLWKIYEEAQKNITEESFYNGDWSKATPQERLATKQKFDYVLNSSNKGVESLARFISMGLATEEIHNLLGFNTINAKPSKQKTWFDTFNAWLRYVFAWVGGKLVKTSAADPANKQLQKLVNNLTALDIRNRQSTVAMYEKAWNLIGKVTAPLDNAAQTLRQYATNRDFLRNSKYLPLRTLGSIAALDAKAMGETIPKLIRETRDKARPNEKLGEAMTALMESTAMTQIRKAMEALIRQANLNAKERQDRTDNVKKAIMNWFKDGGKHITKEMHKAITYTLLRSDAQSLLTTFGLNKTIGLLLDTNKLKNEIDLVTKDISQYQNGNSMINQAMRLAYYMVTNKGGMGLNKNPTAIAIGLGTSYQMPLDSVDQALVGQLDVLVSLYAMKYTSATDRKILGDMYKENPEALEGLLQMHKGFMTDAATEFKDNPLNYVKGWMPEIVNPYREVRTASGIPERDQMLKEGWKLIEEIKPHGTYLMVHPDIGYQRLVSGAVDLQNSHRKGTEIVNRTSRNYLDTVRANLDYSNHIASIPFSQFDPSKQATGLIPAYDTDGVPMGFNYEMASWVRDKEMERNNNFADLMGAYAGSMYYKPAKRNQSVTVANVLFEDYKQNYQKNPNSYIKLSGKSTDPRIVEMWRMLPKDFRQRATELYGKGEPIVINNEAFLLAFGFKKWSITNIWNKKAEDRTDMETMFVTMAEKLLGETSKAKIAKAGHIWTEVVSKAKDFIVIRSISVLWNNVLSNGLMLMANGINPITIAKEWTFATANVRSYQKLHSELIQLKANTLAGKGNSAVEAQIKRIESQLEANPMSKYINEGLLSSIVEDVTIQQGDYTYDSELKKKIDNVTGWLPDSIKTIGAWAVLNPSTQGYQFLATTTQLSDFVAKVTLAKHLESKGMDFKAAISEASQTFINYDVPQGVGMQYMNDMGLFMFTKFFLRIQAVLLKLMDKKAATVLAQHIATEGLTDMQGILDPMALARIGWPFEEGAFSIVGAAMSIAPVNAVLGN